MQLINIIFNISLPQINRYKVFYSKSIKTFFPNKYFDVDIYTSNALISFDFVVTWKQDHEGFTLCVSFLGLSIDIDFYDCRCWDYENKCWMTLDTKTFDSLQDAFDHYTKQERYYE